MANTVRSSSHGVATARARIGVATAEAPPPRYATLRALNSWPDKREHRQARRLLSATRRNTDGRKISWDRPLILAGHVALEFDGIQDLRCRRRKREVWESEDDI